MLDFPGEFKEFPKIPRLSRDIVVTEKLDGTNAIVHISDDGLQIQAGSRSRWITPSDDNYGFARWVEANKTELLTLGPGTHYGEWWGQGIQRTYGLTEKRFSLFNTKRWATGRPACCGVVPVLYTGPFSLVEIEASLLKLATFGSEAAPGFMSPEGVVIFHVAGGYLFKKTIEKDEEPKGKRS